MKGRIHSLQSLGTVDGPGVRCVIFMQGCPLRCVCCHNPDSWDLRSGEEMETDALLHFILRFRGYFGKRGGVTVSGGEPLLQAPFIFELFEKLKDHGVHTALDTSGCMLNPDVFRLLDVTDLVLLDHKYPDEESYFTNTKGHLHDVETFLAELETRRKPTWLRRVIIPGLTDSQASIQMLNDTARQYSCVEKIELLPFRNLCQEKYDALGIPFPLADIKPPTNSFVDGLKQLLDERFR